VKVEVKGKMGYLFAGFLSAYEPPVLDNRNFICNSTSNYTSWLANITESNSIVHSEYEVRHHESTNEDCEDYLKMVYADGTEFQEFNNHDMQTITLLSSDINYNDVLNFMDYMDACREKRCNATETYQRSWVVPLRNDFGEIRSLRSHYPHDVSAETVDDRIFLKMNLSI
jgi:hypothetical protein